MPIVAALLYIFNSLIWLIIAVVIVNAIISWLIAFDVLNIRNQTVYRIVSALDGITEPMLRPLRAWSLRGAAAARRPLSLDRADPPSGGRA